MPKGKLTIGRLYSNGAHNNEIEIRIEDSDYNVQTTIRVKPEDFSNALTGLACVDCEIIM